MRAAALLLCFALAGCLTTASQRRGAQQPAQPTAATPPPARRKTRARATPRRACRDTRRQRTAGAAAAGSGSAAGRSGARSPADLLVAGQREHLVQEHRGARRLGQQVHHGQAEDAAIASFMTERSWTARCTRRPRTSGSSVASALSLPLPACAILSLPLLALAGRGWGEGIVPRARSIESPLTRSLRSRPLPASGER